MRAGDASVVIIVDFHGREQERKTSRTQLGICASTHLGEQGACRFGLLRILPDLVDAKVEEPQLGVVPVAHDASDAAPTRLEALKVGMVKDGSNTPGEFIIDRGSASMLCRAGSRSRVHRIRRGGILIRFAPWCWRCRLS